MSRHDGVSCDSCLKGNFRGRRYKCLVCYDYDLCANCYDAGTTTTRHTSDHAMQCILTRTDFEMYYGGEVLTVDQPQSFTCPFCGKKGYLESTLQDHITAEHSDSATEVVCPICAALPGGDPNHVTDDFATHLTLDHRPPRDFDEPVGVRHGGRIAHATRGRGTRTRRGNIHFPTGMSSSGGREAMDPIAELLSQLSSVRSRAVAAQSVSSQLQQLEMQLQSTRQQLERLPRRQTETYAAVTSKPATIAANAPSTTPPSSTEDKSQPATTATAPSNFLLSRCTDSPPPDEPTSKDGAHGTNEGDRSLFIQELLVTTLAQLLPPPLHEPAMAAPITTGSASRKECDTDDSEGPLAAPTCDAPPVVHTPNNKHSPIALTSPADVRSVPRCVAPLPELQQSQQAPAAVVMNRRPARSHQFTPAWMGAAYPPVDTRHSPGLREQRSGAAAKRSMLKHVEGAKKNDPPH